MKTAGTRKGKPKGVRLQFIKKKKPSPQPLTYLEVTAPVQTAEEIALFDSLFKQHAGNAGCSNKVNYTLLTKAYNEEVLTSMTTHGSASLQLLRFKTEDHLRSFCKSLTKKARHVHATGAATVLSNLPPSPVLLLMPSDGPLPAMQTQLALTHWVQPGNAATGAEAAAAAATAVTTTAAVTTAAAAAGNAGSDGASTSTAAAAVSEPSAAASMRLMIHRFGSS
jgi:hypothetical protein